MAVIALDIGGTKIHGALVVKGHSIVKRLRVPTLASNGKKFFVNTVKQVISSLIDNSHHKITGIGISLPGFSDNGKIVFAGNILSFLVGTDLKSMLERTFKIPVVIENDANCFALAESIYGAGRDYSVILGIIWGSGVGGGLVIRKKIVDKHTNKVVSKVIYPGVFGGALEIGHIPVKDTTLEKIAGGSFILRRYVQLGGKEEHDTVSSLYRSDDKLAKQVIEEAIDAMARGIATGINILNPDIVVVGGGVSQLPKAALNKLFSRCRRYALKSHTGNLEFRRFEISNDSGLMGAAILAGRL